MKRFFKEHAIEICMCFFMTLCIAIVFYGFYCISNFGNLYHYHVHFIDTNECYDVKNAYVNKGCACITFNDDSYVKCSADNVVVFVDKTCSYCGAVYEK